MSKKKNKFTNLWKTQTELGKSFGISAIKVGKYLTEEKLKDKNGATDYALINEYAKRIEAKDGKIYYMWNKWKVESILKRYEDKLSKVDYWVNYVCNEMKKYKKMDDNGEHKLATVGYYSILDEIPKDIVEEVKLKAGLNGEV